MSRLCSLFTTGSCEAYWCCTNKGHLSCTLMSRCCDDTQFRPSRLSYSSCPEVRNNNFAQAFSAPIQTFELRLLLQSGDKVLLWGHLVWTHFSMGSPDFVSKGVLVWFWVLIYVWFLQFLKWRKWPGCYCQSEINLSNVYFQRFQREVQRLELK